MGKQLADITQLLREYTDTHAKQIQTDGHAAQIMNIYVSHVNTHTYTHKHSHSIQMSCGYRRVALIYCLARGHKAKRIRGMQSSKIVTAEVMKRSEQTPNENDK